MPALENLIPIVDLYRNTQEKTLQSNKTPTGISCNKPTVSKRVLFNSHQMHFFLISLYSGVNLGYFNSKKWNYVNMESEQSENEICYLHGKTQSRITLQHNSWIKLKLASPMMRCGLSCSLHIIIDDKHATIKEVQCCWFLE